ncbi:hypothetical protein BJ170DRAFT_123979 [Xylariales sp. AK1849]|nr:hypothetical protein BJ170DRAFT_123979 [Xylariales sp. AK1849]
MGQNWNQGGNGWGQRNGNWNNNNGNNQWNNGNRNGNSSNNNNQWNNGNNSHSNNNTNNNNNKWNNSNNNHSHNNTNSNNGGGYYAQSNQSHHGPPTGPRSNNGYQYRNQQQDHSKFQHGGKADRKVDRDGDVYMCDCPGESTLCHDRLIDEYNKTKRELAVLKAAGERYAKQNQDFAAKWPRLLQQVNEVDLIT